MMAVFGIFSPLHSVFRFDVQRCAIRKYLERCRT